MGLTHYDLDVQRLIQLNKALNEKREALQQRNDRLADEITRMRKLFPMALDIDEAPFYKDPASDLHCVPMEVLMAEIVNRLYDRGLLKRG